MAGAAVDPLDSGFLRCRTWVLRKGWSLGGIEIRLAIETVGEVLTRMVQTP